MIHGGMVRLLGDSGRGVEKKDKKNCAASAAPVQ